MRIYKMSFVTAIAAATLTLGCATAQKRPTAPAISMRGTADAVIHISGLS
ncbi:MAG: hypothetical protein IH989_02840 [Planctomycetes bacterium]|nr:hypothetical protein [Planctomycetota bacterium]